MKAWLERVEPAGDRITLPDGSGAFVFGSGPKSTIVFDDPLLSARHCELIFETGFWRLRDLGSDAGTRVNGAPIGHVRALFSGDVIDFGRTRLKFATDLPPDDPRLLAAIARNPELDEPWLVYADQLQENGDPLGERIVRARTGGRLDHLPWLGSLWEPFVSGELEIDWRLGFVRKATLRSAAGRLALDWHTAVTMLVNLRIGKFLRELSVDVPRLEATSPVRVSESIVEAQRYLASIPGLPESLEQVSLGYHVTPAGAAPLTAIEELAARAPRLRGTPVYLRGSAARLKVISQAEGVKLSGIADGARAITGVMRLRRGTRTQLHLESPPGIPFMADGNPCYLTITDGRVQLVAGRLRGEVRVNNRIDSLYQLLPGDVIDVQATARFRFEVVP